MNLTDSQLRNIDHQIESFSKVSNYDGAWRIFANLLCNIYGIESPKDNPVRGLFSETVQYSTRKAIAICILRIYNIDPKAIKYNQSFYLNAFRLFDKSLGEIYRIYNIRAADQNYAKESQLSDFIANIDREIYEHLIITSLSEIEHFEKKLKKIIGDKKYSDVLGLFVPGLDIGALYNKVFTAINNYINCQIGQKLEYFTSAVDEIEKIISRAKEINTKYSTILVLKPFMKIKELLTDDLNNSPISKPAKLKLISTGKKYPFKTVNEAFPINFEIVNHGQGFAYETSVVVRNFNEEIALKNEDIYIGTIDSEKTVRQIECKVIKPEEVAILSLEVRWKNFDGNIDNMQFDIEFYSQNSDVDWDKLKLKQPYSLKPVEHEQELVGRNEKLNELIALCRNSDSCFITGQKRVGKTSLVKILKEKIVKDITSNVIPIYVSLQLEPILIDTIDILGKRICKALKDSDPKLSSLVIPEINHSLGSIYDFLTDSINLLDEKNIVIIIDEFDQLPLELYRRGDIGDSLFLALKNLSTEAKISFILVGGEKMAFIKNVQAIHLNLFRTYSLDYFDAENSWSDFEELVRHPVKNNFEIDDRAIQRIYSYTLGHPYFTKKICQELYTLCINRHDTHVTENEMLEAITKAISTSDVTDFAHFWDDGIMEKGDEQEEISVIRRRSFIALLDANGDNISSIKFHNYNLSQSEFDNCVNEFCVRQIIQKVNGGISFRIKFFHEWLSKYGSQKIFTTPADQDTIAERKKLEEAATIKAEEISALLKIWGPYLGKEITTDKVRAWLKQFGENVFTQRLMFRLLQNVLFYDNNLIRVCSQEIYKTIIRKLTQSGQERVLDNSRRKRDDIIVSHLEESFAKSSSEYAKLFADENSIYADSAVPKGKLEEYLNSNTGIKALVFIDDFAGSGDSICKSLKEINENIGPIIRAKKILVFVGIICGFKDAKSRIQRFLESLSFKVELIFSKELDEYDRCFSDYSKVFPFINERNKAKSICLDFGEKLYPGHALGYKDCQALVAFPNACPNNTLPILWQETESWIPIFKRV